MLFSELVLDRQLIKIFGGEVIVFGPWELMLGEGAYHNGMIIRFPDKDKALEWYNSPTYQALVDTRNAGLDCRIPGILSSKRRRAAKDALDRVGLADRSQARQSRNTRKDAGS